MSTNGVLTMTERASAPDTPTTSDWRFYFKSDGLYYVDDAGNETGPVSTGTGATTALDNLASVQVNTDIIPDTDDTHDLGSSAARWAEVWADDLIGDLEIEVYNNTGSPIAIEQVVYVSGFNVGASLPEVSLADADAGSGAEVAVGITKVAISNGSSGRIVISGQATYPTTGLSEGDRLYLDTTAGGLTATRPTSGNLLEFGEVLRVGASGTGVILVNPQGVRQLPVSANQVHKFASTQTSTSGTFVDVDATNAAVTITATGGGIAYVTCHFRGIKATAGSGFYRLTDGTNNSTAYEIENGITNVDITLVWAIATSAGSTTYKLQYRTDDANAVQVRHEKSLTISVMEVA